jgi:hypothetical protein
MRGEPGKLPSAVSFGREVCGDLAAAEQREWLVTNGLGGYASGTVAGLLTRRYHGLLVAALPPPHGRTRLLTRVDETATYDGQIYALFCNRWSDGKVEPAGHRYLESFRLEGTTPVWSYAFKDALLEKRIWMEPGANTTYVRYDLRRGSTTIALPMKAIVDAETDQILGVAILGVEGGEVMTVLQMAMMGGVPYTAIRDGVFAHPTLAEALNTLFTAVES